MPQGCGVLQHQSLPAFLLRTLQTTRLGRLGRRVVPCSRLRRAPRRRSLTRRSSPVLKLLNLGLMLLSASTAGAFQCRDWASRVPGLTDATCSQIHLHASGHHSVKGLPLQYTDLLPEGDIPSPMRRVLVLGGIHGDELTSSTLAIYWLQMLQNSPESTPRRSTYWRFVPLLNPDGLLTTPPSRTNANGVDLNRNFPTPRWLTEAPQYWAQRTRKDPRRFPGPRALSEPETRYAEHLIRSWKPHLIVSIHAPFGVLDFDSPPGQAHTPPRKLGKLYLQQVGVYPGSLGNYAGVHLGIPVVTVELPHAQRAPSVQEARLMATDLNRWMDTHLKPAW